MQVDWHLGALFESRGVALESEADGLLSQGDAAGAWHAYTMAAEQYRMCDRPLDSVRLFEAVYGLVEEYSIPWLISRLHHIGSLTALSRYSSARHLLATLGPVEIPQRFRELYLDVSVGVHLGCGELEYAIDAVTQLANIDTEPARLCFQFRNTELCFLQGHVHQAREGIEHTERLLGTHTNAAAGLAALYGLRAELFEFEGALDEAESAQRQACGYLRQTRRLGPLLGALGQWVWIRHKQGTEISEPWLFKAIDWSRQRGLMSTTARLMSMHATLCVDDVESQTLFHQAWLLADQHQLSRTASVCRYVYLCRHPNAADVKGVFKRALADAKISVPLRILIERQMC